MRDEGPQVSDDVRIERDLLGEVAVPAQSLHGAHTERALENFALAGEPVHPELARAFGTVKLACARTNLNARAASCNMTGCR